MFVCVWLCDVNSIFSFTSFRLVMFLRNILYKILSWSAFGISLRSVFLSEKKWGQTLVVPSANLDNRDTFCFYVFGDRKTSCAYFILFCHIYCFRLDDIKSYLVCNMCQLHLTTQVTPPYSCFFPHICDLKRNPNGKFSFTQYEFY